MLKNYFFIFVFFITFSGFSQSDGLYGSWLLEHLKINNITYNMNQPDEAQTDDSGNRILLNFHETPTKTFDTYICNEKSGEYIINETDGRLITFTSIGTTLEVCNNLGNQDFENLYFNFFQESTTYEFEIGCLLSSDACYLYIYKPNGDEAHFWNGQLSTNKNDKFDLSIYPNPVKDKLFVSTTNNLSHYNVEIFDVLGELKISEQLKSKSINVAHLPKGVYFLVVKDVLGNSTTKKFVKLF